MTNFKDKEDVKRLLGNRAGKSELTPMLNAIGTIIQLRKEINELKIALANAEIIVEKYEDEQEVKRKAGLYDNGDY